VLARELGDNKAHGWLSACTVLPVSISPIPAAASTWTPPGRVTRNVPDHPATTTMRAPYRRTGRQIRIAPQAEPDTAAAQVWTVKAKCVP